MQKQTDYGESAILRNNTKSGKNRHAISLLSEKSLHALSSVSTKISRVRPPSSTSKLQRSIRKSFIKDFKLKRFTFNESKKYNDDDDENVSTATTTTTNNIANGHRIDTSDLYYQQCAKDILSENFSNLDEVELKCRKKISIELKLLEGIKKLKRASCSGGGVTNLLDAAIRQIVLNKKLKALVLEIQDYRAHKVLLDPSNSFINNNVQPCRASFAISNTKAYSVFCLLNIGSQFFETKLLANVDKNTFDLLFDEIIIFDDVPKDFTCTIEVYAHRKTSNSSRFLSIDVHSLPLFGQFCGRLHLRPNCIKNSPANHEIVNCCERQQTTGKMRCGGGKRESEHCWHGLLDIRKNQSKDKKEAITHSMCYCNLSMESLDVYFSQYIDGTISCYEVTNRKEFLHLTELEKDQRSIRHNTTILNNTILNNNTTFNNNTTILNNTTLNNTTILKIRMEILADTAQEQRT
ncbi:hypothetical protein HELRODRAFT_174937 [Helobdella robusta]|uniref:Anillin homology domain-containing protein n=1 Tax=Helobdella robusta TaxID=6412 RepID=T1F8M9_HELRO|nr:hypothetical protein HELRODRAFT_174937 [Helobdella robusta]ESO01382.1 hypothetical protein HELRODRAFT_174937 [Helobdella robusta]